MSTNEAESQPTINDVLRALIGSIVRHVRPTQSPLEVVQNHPPIVSATSTRDHDARPMSRLGSPSNIVPSAQSQSSHYETTRVLFRFHEPVAHHSALSPGSELSQTGLEPSSTANIASPLVSPSATSSFLEHTSHLSEMLPQISAGTESEPIFDSETWLPSLSPASSDRANSLENYRVRRHITLIDVGPRPNSAADEHSTDSSALSNNDSEWRFETPSPRVGAATSTWPITLNAANSQLILSNQGSTSTLLDVRGGRVDSWESEIASNWERVHQSTDLGLTRTNSILTSWQLFDRIITQLMNQVDSGPSPAPSDVIASIPHVTADAEMIAKNTQCTICLEGFLLQEVVRRINCGHIFHSDCIIRWLELHGTCPVCRTRLVRSVADHHAGALTDSDRVVLLPAPEHVGVHDPSSDVVASIIDDVTGILSPESSSTVAMSTIDSTAPQRNLSATACTIAAPDAAVVLPDVAITAVEANTSRMLAGEAHDSATDSATAAGAAGAVDDDSVRPSQVSLVLFRLFSAMHFQV